MSPCKLYWMFDIPKGRIYLNSSDDVFIIQFNKYIFLLYKIILNDQ